MKIRILKYNYVLTAALAILLSSCLSTQKGLKDYEYFLYKQSIKGNKNFSYYELEELLRQKTNRKILELPVMPYLYIYNLYGDKTFEKKAEKRREKARNKYEKKLAKNPDDSLKLSRKFEKQLKKIDEYQKEGPFLKREVGEPPTIFDYQLAEETRKQLSLYLFKHGYFYNEVELNIDTFENKQIVNSEYLIKEGKPVKVRNIEYLSNDSLINSFANPLAEEFNSNLKVGMVYNEEKINKEITGLETYYKNHGFFAFRKQYVFVQVNDTFSDFEVDLKFRIINPNPDNGFKRFKVERVQFIAESNYNPPHMKRDTLIADDIRFLQYREKVKKKLLTRKIKIRPGTFYNYDFTVKSQRNLSNLNMYRFANIRYDSTQNGFTANIYTSPLPKYSTSVESGVAVTQWLPGPFGTVNFRNRNVFNGAEILDIGLRGGIEAQTSFSQENQVYRSSELGANMAITFPSLALPSRLRFRFTDFNPKTRLNLGIGYIRRPEYARTNINSNLRYSISPSNNSVINLQLLDNSLLYTQILDPAFSTYLNDLFDRGNNLIYSFGQSVNTSINAEYTYNDFSLLKSRQSKYFNIYLESGGTVWNLLSNSFLESNDTILGLQYFRYSKASFDFRKYFPTNRENTIAVKFKTGIAYPYGINEVLPYEKYFFIGGNNSMRAWRPRRLGPGSYALINSDGSINYSFEQPGEILLEASAEWRFDLISFIEGAFFIDAGNVWRLNPVPTLPGGQFELNRFYKEIGIGSGYGIRFDFSFLILRLDAGFKVFDPGRKLNQRFSLNSIADIDPFNPNKTLWNIGIGYPF
ncbi:MAG: BamA/TamA family outer membrane protein [Cytophagales bacterium]